MDFFELIMSPFVSIIENLFLYSYSATGNYGVSIILLSLMISLLLLPIFIYIEKAKKKDDLVKSKMQPLIDEVKRCYKGQERFYYIKTINRQHNYNSLRSLIPILSLLLQIPFFIAAYQFLDQFEPLQNVSFGLISDLSQADGIFGMVNILPIIMTLVNIATAYYYTRNSNKTELKQMLILAGVFLVLLYNLPSGLVLYWTMNNVFSFLRLFITNPEVFRKKKTKSTPFLFKTKFAKMLPQLKVVLVSSFVILGFVQLKWAFTYNFDDIFIRLATSLAISILLSFIYAIILLFSVKIKHFIDTINVSTKVFFSLLFLTIYFYFAARFYFSGENISLSILSLLTLLPTQFIGYIYIKRSSLTVNKFIFKFSVISLVIIVIYQLLAVITLITGDEISLSIGSLNMLFLPSAISDVVIAGLIFSVISIGFYIKKYKLELNMPVKLQWLILILSVTYIYGLIFIWNPIIVYSSFSANFDFPVIEIITNNISMLLISILINVFVFFILPKKIKPLFVQVYLFLSLVVLLYSSIIPFDVGTLQINFFSQEGNLVADLYYYILEAVLIVSTFFIISKVFKSKYTRIIIYSLVILNIFLIGQSLYLGVKTGSFSSKHKYSGKLIEIPFSKTEKNVVYFIIDEAQGWLMNEIFDKNPELRTSYDGFVWYPNSVSESNFTYSSVPSMMCGEDFTVANMNKDDTLTILQKVTNTTDLFYDNIKDKGYYLTANHLKYAHSNPLKVDNVLPKWCEKWSEVLDIKYKDVFWFNRLWQNALFSSVPLSLKPGIYNHNKWFDKVDITIVKEIKSSELLNKYVYVKILPEISNTDSEKSSFIFIHSMFTHAPWDMITTNNELISDVSPYENQKQFIDFFVNWIQWMKDNDVYDNTKILLVSDHGKSWWRTNHKIDLSDFQLEFTEDGKISIYEFLRLNPLMLIKDYDSRGQLKEDWRLLSNMDSYAIAFDKNDPTKMDSTSREINTYFTEWHNDIRERKKYNIRRAFKVNNYVFDLDNWEPINTDDEK